MIQFILQHQFWAAVVVYWIFSAAVSALPEPSGNARPGYLWVYRFSHTIAGNLSTAFGGRIPGLSAGIKTTAAGLLVLALLGCGVHYQLHPGALNTVDSAAYDTLLVARTAIDEARTASQAGQLPPDSRDGLNTLIKAYNVTRDSWLTYRGAIAANVASADYFQQLNKNVTALITAIRTFKQKEPQR